MHRAASNGEHTMRLPSAISTTLFSNDKIILRCEIMSSFLYSASTCSMNAVFFLPFKFCFCKFKCEMHKINSYSQSAVGIVLGSTREGEQVRVVGVYYTHYTMYSICASHSFSSGFIAAGKHHSLWQFHSEKLLICNDKYATINAGARGRPTRMN